MRQPLCQRLGTVAQPAQESANGCWRFIARATACIPQSSEIDRRHKLSRDEFLQEYYSTNRPVIITGMMDDWPAMGKWDLDYFGRNFGDRVVEVQMGRTTGANYETRAREVHPQNSVWRFCREGTNGRPDQRFLPDRQQQFRQPSHPARVVGRYRAGAGISRRQDQPGGFFWMGPAGTITPFHHDLTNNFMAQVIGRKRIKLAPSWDMPLMRQLPALLFASRRLRHSGLASSRAR